jgi:hypothetical protein
MCNLVLAIWRDGGQRNSEQDKHLERKKKQNKKFQVQEQ